MKPLRLLSDFALGVLLIGGAPVTVFAAILFLYGQLLKVATKEFLYDDDARFFVILFTCVSVPAAMVCAIKARFQKRLLPKGFVVLEILFGSWIALTLGFVMGANWR